MPAGLFLAVLRMVSQGYLVVDSKPMRPLLGAARVRWDEHATGPAGLPELTSRRATPVQGQRDVKGQP